jgi:hypothetical protein
MEYAIEFFEIQEVFARRVSAVTGIPLEEALLKYTSCYKRIGIEDWDFNGNHPTWRIFMDRINGGQSVAEAAYQLSGVRPDVVKKTQRFGCMGFDCRGDVVVMHFRNDFSSPEGPLSKHQIPARLLELRKMFGYIFEHHKDARVVEGFSWLYNYEAYRRLFPTEYTTNMDLIGDSPVRIHSTWGQFIDSSGGLHSERALAFRNTVTKANSLSALLAAFPFRTYKPRADIKFFYSFYGIEEQ